MAYASAQHIYAHFFSEKTVFDWYTPDRKAIVRVLHELAGFDLSEINRDIIGTVYGQHLEAKHKHEKGMYYTPPEVVSLMLDRIGYRGPDVINRKLIDISCGSGGFLVEAANRLVDAYRQHYKAQGKDIPAEEVQTILDQIKNSLHGIDINPFATSLAETNLLIQVIDLFGIAYASDKGQNTRIDRFHIYSSDALLFSPSTLAKFRNELSLEVQGSQTSDPNEDLPVEDQLKIGVGKWKDRFDYVVGNPPYVRADENEDMGQYRERIKSEHPIETVRGTMVLKWDMFVPFVASSLNLLKQGGRMAMITSNAIGTADYCEPLRAQMLKMTQINEIHFFQGVSLFEDANVQNIIAVTTKTAPPPQSATRRYFHNAPPKAQQNQTVASQDLRQCDYASGVFRINLPEIRLSENVQSVALEDICFISCGMELQADEKRHKGEFVLENLLSDEYDEKHTVPYIGGRDVTAFGLVDYGYLEYGDGLRAPEKIRRPRFQELFEKPKLMFARFGGVAYDDGTWHKGQFLKCNHTVIAMVPWHQLKGVENRSISTQLGHRRKFRDSIERYSSTVAPHYVLGFLNSSQCRLLLNGLSTSSIPEEVQPDDLRRISVLVPKDKATTAKIADLAKEATGIQKQLLALRKAGWRIDDGSVAAPAVTTEDLSPLRFDSAIVTWGIELKGETCRTEDLVRRGHSLYSGRREALGIASTMPERAMEWLRRQLAACPKGSTIATIKRQIHIPRTPEIAAAALVSLLKKEEEVKNQVARIPAIQEKISELFAPMFATIEHPPITQQEI
jgi:type I restriction-modification system DNA methylase subunit